LSDGKKRSPKQKLVIKEEKVSVASRYLQGVSNVVSEKVNGNGNGTKPNKVSSPKGKEEPNCEGCMHLNAG